MQKLFGTDGPRGIAVTDLTCELAMQTGRAAAVVLAKKSGEKARIIVGKDTRLSSDALEAAVCAGICSVGADAEILGVVPTPAVAGLIKEREAVGGIMISGSHNSAEFNGIKIFSAEERKLSDEEEEEIERLVLTSSEEIKLKSHDKVGRIVRFENAAERYIERLKSTVNTDLDGLKIAIDCANGCASYTAETLFTALGAEVHVIANAPDGTNINKKCGCTNIEKLMEYVLENKLDCGLAFDGDADRCIAVDEAGGMIDGDRLIAIFAKAYKEQGRLAENTAVITAMSNLGLLKYAEKNGIELVTSGAGDRYVLERMLEGGYKIGGEQSGHIIFLDDAYTGDGQLTGARLLQIMKQSGKKMSELAEPMQTFPQVKLNVRINPHYKELWKNDSEITELIERHEKTLGADGRIIVRESGTEPIVRIMIEGKDFGVINTMAMEIARCVKHRCAFRF